MHPVWKKVFKKKKKKNSWPQTPLNVKIKTTFHSFHQFYFEICLISEVKWVVNTIPCWFEQVCMYHKQHLCSFMARLCKVWEKKYSFSKVHKQTSHLIFLSIFSSFPNRLPLIEVLRVTAEPIWFSATLSSEMKSNKETSVAQLMEEMLSNYLNFPWWLETHLIVQRFLLYNCGEWLISQRFSFTSPSSGVDLSPF